MGNAVTGTVCTDGGGRSNVTASTRATMGGSSRNTVGVATAIGNTASFTATSPGD